MPTPRINGTLGKIRQGIRTKFDPSTGPVTTIEWASAGDNLNGYARALRELGIQHEHSASSVRSTLSEYATGAAGGLSDTTTDRWEVLANENQLDLKEHPKWATISSTQRALILADVNRHANGKPQKLDADDQPLWQDLDTETQQKMQAFYDLMIRGTTHYPVYNWVVRHTTNASAEFTENVADDGVGTVYTTAQLLSEISNSSYWTYPCPARLRSKISSIVEPTPPIAGLVWGWLKKPSNEATAANNRIDISTEYVLAQWPAIVYG